MTKIKINCDSDPHNNHALIPIHNRYVIFHVCSVLFIVCLYVCVCECVFQNNVQMYTSNQYSWVRGPLREGLSLSQADLAFFITAHHLCAFLMYLAR